MAVSFLCSGSVLAKVPVWVHGKSTPDLAGKKFVLAAQDAVRVSTSLELVDESKARMAVVISTMDRNEAKPGTETVSLVVLFRGEPDEPFFIYTTSSIDYSPSAEVKETADALVSLIEKAHEALMEGERIDINQFEAKRPQKTSVPKLDHSSRFTHHLNHERNMETMRRRTSPTRFFMLIVILKGDKLDYEGVVFIAVLIFGFIGIIAIPTILKKKNK